MNPENVKTLSASFLQASALAVVFSLAWKHNHEYVWGAFLIAGGVLGVGGKHLLKRMLIKPREESFYE